MPLLRGTANRVENAEVFLRPVAGRHGGADTPLHFLGFGTQHGGLVGHADLAQMQIRVEPLGASTTKLVQKSRTVAALAQVGAKKVRLLKVIDHNEVAATPRGSRAGTGGPRLFMIGLAMDN